MKKVKVVVVVVVVFLDASLTTLFYFDSKFTIVNVFPLSNRIDASFRFCCLHRIALLPKIGL